MRFVIHLLLMVCVALGVGFGLSYYALNDGRLFGAARIGPWQAWPDVGSSQPNPYTRAHLARAAAFPLGQSEGLRFAADTDSAGQPLTRACTYTIAGATPLASFWTLAAIDADGTNIATPDGQVAMRSDGIVRDNDGAILIHVGTRLAPQNWLELTGTGPFQLQLTLYDTNAFSSLSSGGGAMPSIVRGTCV